MTEASQQDQRATRRGVLLGVGLAGLGGALAGCSTAAVPYDANEAGVPSSQQAPAAPMSSAAMPSGQATGAGGGGMAQGSGTVLGLAKDIPVGGGTVFMDQKVVVTQPARGVFMAFSAVCTHVGCTCNKIANGTINCPCHGSEFKITDGSVVAGPAPAPLAARTISVSDGKIMLK